MPRRQKREQMEARIVGDDRRRTLTDREPLPDAGANIGDQAVARSAEHVYGDAGCCAPACGDQLGDDLSLRGVRRIAGERVEVYVEIAVDPLDRGGVFF